MHSKQQHKVKGQDEDAEKDVFMNELEMKMPNVSATFEQNEISTKYNEYETELNEFTTYKKAQLNEISTKKYGTDSNKTRTNTYEEGTDVDENSTNIFGKGTENYREEIEHNQISTESYGEEIVLDIRSTEKEVYEIITENYREEIEQNEIMTENYGEEIVLNRRSTDKELNEISSNEEGKGLDKSSSYNFWEKNIIEIQMPKITDTTGKESMTKSKSNAEVVAKEEHNLNFELMESSDNSDYFSQEPNYNSYDTIELKQNRRQDLSVSHEGFQMNKNGKSVHADYEYKGIIGVKDHNKNQATTNEESSIMKNSSKHMKKGDAKAANVESDIRRKSLQPFHKVEKSQEMERREDIGEKRKKGDLRESNEQSEDSNYIINKGDYNLLQKRSKTFKVKKFKSHSARDSSSENNSNMKIDLTKSEEKNNQQESKINHGMLRTKEFKKVKLKSPTKNTMKSEKHEKKRTNSTKSQTRSPTKYNEKKIESGRNRKAEFNRVHFDTITKTLDEEEDDNSDGSAEDYSEGSEEDYSEDSEEGYSEEYSDEYSDEFDIENMSLDDMSTEEETFTYKTGNLKRCRKPCHIQGVHQILCFFSKNSQKFATYPSPALGSYWL